MFVSVVSLSQPSSRLWYLSMLNVCLCCLVISAQLLALVSVYVKSLRVLSRYLNPVVGYGICYVKCLCVLARYLSPIVGFGIWLC